MTYTTIQGDTWDAIAYKIYGQESLMTFLIEANPAHVRTTIFGSGVVLYVPEASEALSDDLPPWKR